MMSTTLQRSELTPCLAGWCGGSGPPLLLIHGVGLRAEAWGPMLPGLMTKFSIMAVDLPGHGASARLSGRTDLAAYTDRLASVLSEPAFVVGHSMGALIAMELAIRYRERVTAVAPLNAIFRRTEAASRAVRQRASQLANETLPDPSGTLERWFGAAPQGKLKKARDACCRWLTTVDPVGYGQAYGAFAQADGPADGALADISCPALFITGEEEPNSTPAMSKALARQVRHGRTAIVAGARHMMPMTHGAEVSELLCAFYDAEIQAHLQE